MILDYFRLAFNNVRHRGVRSWLTMLGIFLGIAAVVSLISLGNGLREAITGQFATLDADKLVVQNTGTSFGPPGSTVVRKLTSRDIDLIKEIPRVDKTVSRLIRVVNIKFNKVAEFNYIASLPEKSDELNIVYDALNVEVVEGKLLDADERGKVILGNDFTDDRFGKKIRVGQIISVQNKNFEVAGILKKASTFQINSVVLMPEEDMKTILNIDDEIDLIVVQVEKNANVAEVAASIEKKVRKDRNEKIGEEDFSVQTPLQSVQSINTVLDIVNLIVAGIAAVSLLIGGIGIANTMYTSVLERTKEIGIMKAIGARNRDIAQIFLIESGILGLVGGVIGAVIGLGLAFGVSALARAFFSAIDLKVQISWPLLGLAIGISLTLGILSGILPALQASRLNPVEALRK